MIFSATLSIAARKCVARFRLRFLLQELDLIGSVITLGRSPDCQITLDDPLVSRVHAELTLTDSGVHVRDLGSRNGVRINDVLIDSRTALEHKDRLRLGSQDLVFLAMAGEPARVSTATGAIARCPECDRPFATVAKVCPHCGARNAYNNPDGAETQTGVELVEAPSWTFRLIAEVLERALRAGRIPEAERMLERAARDIDARVRSGGKLGLEQLADASSYALRLAALERQTKWASWAVGLYRHEHRLPGAEIMALIEELDRDSLRALRPMLEALARDPAATLRSGHVADARRLDQLLQRAV
jgi:FHA domain